MPVLTICLNLCEIFQFKQLPMYLITVQQIMVPVFNIYYILYYLYFRLYKSLSNINNLNQLWSMR